MANNKTISIAFPFKDDLVDGKFMKMNTTTLNDIRSSLYFFITTKKGERWYDPNFGTKLYEFLFEKNDTIVDSEIKISLKADIEKYFKNTGSLFIGRVGSLAIKMIVSIILARYLGRLYNGILTGGIF